MKIVFIAGPFRGDGSREAKLKNIAVAREHVRKLVDAEIPYYSPHLNLDQEIVDLGTKREHYAMTANAEHMVRADILAVLPGWQDSKGTIYEIEEAKKREMPIFYLEDANAVEQIKNSLDE